MSAPWATGPGVSPVCRDQEPAEAVPIGAVISEGCTEVQGFLFGQPVKADEIERLLAEGFGLANGDCGEPGTRHAVSGIH